MNILLMLAHSIEEYDQVRLLSSAGYDVFSLGGYIDPAHPHDPKRPALPDAPRHPELQAVVDRLGAADNLTAAKEHLPDDLIDWADVIICHHYEHRWIVPQWDRIRHKRVIWRTVGQSVEHNERMMAPLRAQGMEIIRYSGTESNIPGYAGSDAMIRFYKDPDEWTGWTGDDARVINITQNLYQRDPFTNWRFWEAATKGLPRLALGPGSEAIGGPGELTYPEMQAALRSARAYLYTGTQPASYTLGLIEAMMTGTPIVSIGRRWMDLFAYSPDLFEVRNLLGVAYDDPDDAKAALRRLLADPDHAAVQSRRMRTIATELFGMDGIREKWVKHLGGEPDQKRRDAIAAKVHCVTCGSVHPGYHHLHTTPIVGSKTISVLADRHHAGLYNSLTMLGRRLGWHISTPYGLDWWDQWYWSFGRSTYGDNRLAQQFLLDPAAKPADEKRRDPEFPDEPISGVPLDLARMGRWDIVMATLADNQAGFARFAREHGAAFVVHAGNTHQEIDWSLDPIVLSASESPIGSRGAAIGEEFDSDGLFAFAEPDGMRIVRSFVNCMPSIGCWPLVGQAQALLPDHRFLIHGIDGPDGNIKPIDEIARLMANTGWAWHDKEHGDGFGHVIHYWAARGRPLVGHASHYAGRRAAPLWRDGETCIDLDRHSIGEACAMIAEMSSERHRDMCHAIRETFDSLIDWEADAERVAAILPHGEGQEFYRPRLIGDVA